MKKILILLTEHYPLGAGPEQAFVVPEINAALRRGMEVVVMPTVDRGPQKALPPGATLSRELCDSPLMRHKLLRLLLLGRNYSPYGLASRSVSLAVNKVIKSLYQEDKDAEIYGEAFWLDFQASGLMLAGIPFAARAHRYDILIDKAPKLRRSTALGSRGIFAVSEDGAEELSRRLGSDIAAVSYLGTAVTDKGRPTAPAEVCSFVSIACTEPRKRVHLIIDMLAALALARPGKRVKWIHIGGGSQLEALRRRAAEAMEGLDNLEICLTGEIGHTEAMALLDSEPLSFGISMSESEGLPVSLMEIMARGIPCVATDAGGTRELVTDDTGILLPLDPDPDIFVAGLLPYLDLPARYAVLSAAARRIIAEKFNERRCREEFFDSWIPRS